jgi:zinc protease
VVRLRSGARIVVQPTAAGGPGGSTVAIHLWVFAGTADEDAREHGCAHLLEHMLFKPVAIDRQPHDIASAIEALGGDVNAFTSHDETVFHATVPLARLDEAMAALVRPIAHARPRPADLAHEADVVIEEIKQYDDDPGSRAMQDMVERLFRGHGYGRPVLGLAEEIAAHTAADLRRFLAHNYGGQRLALVVVGPVVPARVIASARRVLGEFGARPRRRASTTPAARSRPHVTVRRDDVHEAHAALGWQAPPWPQADACALELAATALGYGESSWLARELRRRLALVTDAHASLFAGRQASTFAVSAHAPAKRIEPAIVAALAEIARMGRVAIDAESHARARAVLESEVVYRRETVNGLAHTIGYYLSLGDDLGLDRTYLRHVATLVPADVRDACARLLDPRRASLAVVVPKSAFTAAQARALGRRLAAALAGTRRATSRRAMRVDRHGIVVAELPCGLRVRVAPDPSLAMAAGWLVWPGGQRVEPRALSGATPMIASLLTRGTRERDGDTLAREIEGRAAALDGMSGRSSVAMHFECLTRDHELVIRRMFECAQAPAFAEDELAQERRLALDDLAAERDDLAGIASAAAMARLYGNHPYGRRRRGTRESLRALEPRALHRLWTSAYPVGRACLGLCGDLDPHATIELVAALVADAPPVDREPAWPGGVPRMASDRDVRLRRRREQAHLVLAWPGISLADPRVPAMEVLTTILSAQAGRLFLAMREEEGLVYHVSASSTEGIDCGHVSFYAATSQDKLARARQVLERERLRLCREPIGREELERAQAWLIGQGDAALQRRGRVASLLAFNEVYGLGYGAHFSYARRIEAVRAKDVTELANAIFRPSRQVTAIVAG